MPSSDTVSIVIPCFNQARFLRDAIDSALAQTHPDIEVVVVDDGSTDDTLEVARSYADRGVRVVAQPNSGLSAARNSGITASAGAFVCLLDSDDALTPECVELRVALLRSNVRFGLVAGHYVDVNESMDAIVRVAPLRLRNGRTKLVHSDIVKRSVHPSGWLFPRDVVRRCGPFDPFLKSAEDWDFLLRVSSLYDVGYLPVTTCLVRQHGGSMSRNMLRMYDSAASAHRKMAAYSSHPTLYWLRSRAGMFHQTRYILGRIASSDRRDRALWNALKFAARRPPVFVYALAALASIPAMRRATPPDAVWAGDRPAQLSAERS